MSGLRRSTETRGSARQIIVPLIVSPWNDKRYKGLLNSDSKGVTPTRQHTASPALESPPMNLLFRVLFHHETIIDTKSFGLSRQAHEVARFFLI